MKALDRLVTGEGPFTVVECAACEFGLTEPQFDNASLGRYYSDEYYDGFYEHSDDHNGNALHRLRDSYRRRSAHRRYRRPPFMDLDSSAGRILDVGCGGGELLEHFARRGWSTHGIDPSRAASDAASRRGAEVHHGTLDDQPWPEEFFQAITFQPSLEHIPDPIEALQRARSLLAPAGSLVIEVPNWACWQRRRLFRNFWFGLDLPCHQRHFSPRALSRLANLLKLKVRVLGTSSTAISTAYCIHFLIAGRWTPGWKLWLSYGLSLPVLPLVFLGDRIGGGDCCHVVMQRGGS